MTWVIAIIIAACLAVCGCATYPAQEPPPRAPEGAEFVELEDTSWYLSWFEGVEGLLPMASIIAFASDRRLSATAGCNAYSGDYVTDGTDIHIFNLMGTRIDCPPDVAEAERLFIVALQRALRFEIRANMLIIYLDDGIGTLSFARN